MSDIYSILKQFYLSRRISLHDYNSLHHRKSGLELYYIGTQQQQQQQQQEYSNRLGREFRRRRRCRKKKSIKNSL